MTQAQRERNPARTKCLVNSVFDGQRFRHDETVLVLDRTMIGSIRTDQNGPDHRQGLPVYDLRGRTVLPGFVDGHSHFLQMGLDSLELDLAQIDDRSTFFDVLAEAVQHHRSDRPIVGKDWDESNWSDRRVPTRSELDAVSSSIPIMVRRVCGHLAVLNSAALLFFQTGHFQGDPANGLALEETVWEFDKQIVYTAEDYDQALENAQARALCEGVTTVHEITSPTHFRWYQNWSIQDKLKVRVVVYLAARWQHHLSQAGLVAGFGSDRLTFGGLKLFLDGSLGAHTAALSKPYQSQPDNRGLLFYAPGRLNRIIHKARTAGYPLMMHAIGDRAISQLLAVLRKDTAEDRTDLRHRLEHIEVLDADLVQQLADSGLIASCQPNFARRWSQPPDGMNWLRLGPERVRWCNPYAKLFAAGLNVAFGSDCMPFGPLYGLEGAINHPISDQSVSLEQALNAYTAGSAWAAHLEHKIGRIAPGFHADLVVLDRDISSAKTLRDVKVEMTVVNGQIVYERLSS
ncbi:amidohydrolase family protein [bacterium]|nr:amidohydrolase family protein [bacterium]